jgi:hypothetical protein
MFAFYLVCGLAVAVSIFCDLKGFHVLAFEFSDLLRLHLLGTAARQQTLSITNAY